MTDFDTFERGLASLLRADADQSIVEFEPESIARIAILQGSAAVGVVIPLPRRTIRTLARLAGAAAIAVVAVGLAGYLLALRLAPVGGLTSPAPTGQGATSQPALGSWTLTGSMAQARDAHTATLLLDGRVLVVGGFDGDTPLASAEIFDPRTGSWTPTGSLSEARGAHSAALLADGTVLVFGGVSAFGEVDGSKLVSADVVLLSAELYDPVTGAWTSTASMTEARSTGAVALLLDGRVLVAGGWGAGELFGPKLASAELYDPSTRTWTTTGSMSTRRHGQGTVLLPNGTVLVAGGYNDAARLASCEIFDPSTGTWSATARLPEPFLPDTAELLSNGMVLLAGGDVPSGPGAAASDHAALYDVDSATWVLADPMTQPRLSSKGVLLSNGRVLVMGGRAYGGRLAATFATAEVYEPATGTWTAIPDMTAARASQTATLLADGRVLVVGGGSGTGLAVATAEVYDPRGGD